MRMGLIKLLIKYRIHWLSFKNLVTQKSNNPNL